MINTNFTTCITKNKNEKLDLEVRIGGERHFPNFGGGDGDYHGEVDCRNNVEKVTLGIAAADVGKDVSVVVTAHGLAAADSQRYAVVVTGSLDALTSSPSPTYSLKPSPSPTTDTCKHCTVEICAVYYSIIRMPINQLPMMTNDSVIG